MTNARPTRVYVAGPYTAETAEGVEENVSRAKNIGERLFRLGYAPYVPHLSHHWHAQHPHSYEEWMWLCLAWVRAADALLLIAESPGANREANLAKELMIPVVHTVKELRHAVAPTIR